MFPIPTSIWIKAAVVFVAMCVLDFIWAFYTRAVTTGDAGRAASWAMAMILTSGVAQIGYTSDWRLLLPAMAGAFVGTYTALRLTKK